MTPELLNASLDAANAATLVQLRREPRGTLTAKQHNLADLARRNGGRFPIPTSHRAASHPSVAEAELRRTVQQRIDGHELAPAEQPLSEWQGLADACLTSVIALGIAALVGVAIAYGVGVI